MNPFLEPTSTEQWG